MASTAVFCEWTLPAESENHCCLQLQLRQLKTDYVLISFLYGRYVTSKMFCSLLHDRVVIATLPSNFRRWHTNKLITYKYTDIITCRPETILTLYCSFREKRRILRPHEPLVVAA